MSILTFRSKEENFFEAHALQNHDQSRCLFQDHEMKIDIKVEANFEATDEIQEKLSRNEHLGDHFMIKVRMIS